MSSRDLFNLAEACIENEDIAKAKNLIKQAIVLNPANEDVVSQAVDKLLAAQLFSSARKAVESYQRLTGLKLPLEYTYEDIVEHERQNAVPSYKPHTIKAGIDLAAASGYNAATYLTQARSGATIATDYVQAMNRTNIRNNLTSYATTLASYLRTNYPAGVLEDIVGGKTIVPYTGAPLRQTSLPYQDNSVPLEEWDPYIPDEYKPWVTISYEGITNQSFQSLNRPEF
jgi:hypothetical protein